MSAVTPPRAVIDTAAGAGGLVQVGDFLGKGFSRDEHPPLHARADLHKCEGGNLPACTRCARRLAPVGVGQCWTLPEIQGDVCTMSADVDQYRSLYGVPASPGEVS